MANRYSDIATAEFNMNMDLLMKISTNMNIFMDARYSDNFDNMYKALDTLEMLTSPKIEDKNLENIIEWLNKNKDQGYVRDENGKILRENVANRKELDKMFKKAFKLLLLRLDEAGILTKLKTDPGKAMGNFSSS